MTYKVKTSFKQRLMTLKGIIIEKLYFNVRYSKQTRMKMIDEAVKYSLENQEKLDDNILIGRL